MVELPPLFIATSCLWSPGRPQQRDAGYGEALGWLSPGSPQQ